MKIEGYVIELEETIQINAWNVLENIFKSEYDEWCHSTRKIKGS